MQHSLIFYIVGWSVRILIVVTIILSLIFHKKAANLWRDIFGVAGGSGGGEEGKSSIRRHFHPRK